MKFKKKIPNILTLLRIVLIPVFVALMLLKLYNLAVAVFIFAAFTDYLDGYLARKLNAVSDFGKLVDPLADKILVMSALVMLVGQRSEMFAQPWVPAWMVVLILAREVWVTGLRGVAASQGLVIPAGSAGKIKSFFQMLAIVLLLLHDLVLITFGNMRLTCQFFGERLLLISIVFSYWGAWDYTSQVFKKK